MHLANKQLEVENEVTQNSAMVRQLAQNAAQDRELGRLRRQIDEVAAENNGCGRGDVICPFFNSAGS